MFQLEAVGAGLKNLGMDNSSAGRHHTDPAEAFRLDDVQFVLHRVRVEEW